MWSSLHVYPVQNGSIGQVRNASVSGVYSIEEHTLNIDPSVAKSLNHTYPIWAGRHLFSFLIWGLKWSWWLDIYPILTHSHMSNPDIYLDTWTSRPLLTTYDTYTYIYGQRCMCIQLGYTSGYYLITIWIISILTLLRLLRFLIQYAPQCPPLGMTVESTQFHLPNDFMVSKKDLCHGWCSTQNPCRGSEFTDSFSPVTLIATVFEHRSRLPKLKTDHEWWIHK